MICVASKERWSGHGEGGTVVRLEIQGWGRQNPYDSTPMDYQRAKEVCDLVNQALEAAGLAGSASGSQFDES